MNTSQYTMFSSTRSWSFASFITTWLLIAFYSSNTNLVSAATEDIQIEIQHRLSSSQLPTSRGVFIIQKLDTNDPSLSSSASTSTPGSLGSTPISGSSSAAAAAISTQQILASINAKPVQTQTQQIVDIKQNGIYDNEKDLEAFKQLLKTNGLYKIQLRTSFQNATSKYIMAAIPACELQRSGFKEEILLHLDGRNQPIGVSYSSPVIALPRPCDASKVRLPLQFHTRIKLMDPIIAQSVPLQATGPLPPALSKIHPSILNTPSSGIGANGGSGSGSTSGTSSDGSSSVGTGTGIPNQPPPPQSFLQKYWYIVVMLLAYLYLSPGPETKKGTKENNQAVKNNRVEGNNEESDEQPVQQQQSVQLPTTGAKKGGLRPL